jgi:hypothetical protein
VFGGGVYLIHTYHNDFLAAMEAEEAVVHYELRILFICGDHICIRDYSQNRSTQG